MLRTKQMLSFGLFEFPKDEKDASFSSPAFEAPNLIRNDSLTSYEYKAKIICRYLEQLLSI